MQESRISGELMYINEFRDLWNCNYQTTSATRRLNFKFKMKLKRHNDMPNVRHMPLRYFLRTFPSCNYIFLSEYWLK